MASLQNMEFCRNFFRQGLKLVQKFVLKFPVVPLAHITFELSGLILFWMNTGIVSKNVFEMTLKQDPVSIFTSVVVPPMETGISLS